LTVICTTGYGKKKFGDGTMTENPQIGSNSKRKIEMEVQAIFEDPNVSTETKLAYLHSLNENLTTTEKAIGSGFMRVVLCFITFVLLDNGMVDKVILAGTEIKGTGVLLLLFPLIIAFLTYQLMNRVAFAHEIRTVIAFMYRHLSPAIYKNCLDVLTHYPSSRNIESYYGKLVHGKGLRLLDFSTSVVTCVLVFSPSLAVTYCLIRTFGRHDVAMSIWLISAIIAASLILRTFVMEFFKHIGKHDGYSNRNLRDQESDKTTDNHALHHNTRSR